MVYEKQHRQPEALAVYELAAMGNPSGDPGAAAAINARIQALKSAGVKPPATPADRSSLASQHMLMLPLLVKKAGDADFYFLSAGGKVTGIRCVADDPALCAASTGIKTAL